VPSEEREAARQRELALAEQRSLALAEAEVLRAEIETLKAQRAAAEQQRLVEAQERARLERELEVDRAAAKEAREQLAQVRASFDEALAARDAEKRGLDTELTWARAEAQRLSTESRSLTEQVQQALQNATRVGSQLMEAQALLRHSEQEKGSLRTTVEQLKALAGGALPSEPPQGWKPSESAPAAAPAPEKTEGGA
jgi:predicted nucleic acid-binding protein